MRRVSTIAFLFTLAGCAGGMSKDECLYADWRAIGFEDGSRGAPAGAVSSRRAACANKAGVTADMRAYLAGREEGLDQFCRPAKGFDLGAHGGRYDGVCADRGEALFLDAFASGRGLFERQADVNAAANALAAAEADIDGLEHRIASAEAALISPATPHEDRPAILIDIKQMTGERTKIKRALPALHRDLDYAQRELDDYRGGLAAYDPRGAVSARPASY